MGCSKSSSKWEVYSNTILSQGTRNTQINNLTLHLKQLEKEEQKKKTQSQEKERNHKEQNRNKWKKKVINEKEMKETIAKINKTKSWFFEKINKIDKPLARIIKKKGRRHKSTNQKLKRRSTN